VPTEYTIQQLINIGKLSQVLANVDNQNKLLLQSGNLDPRLPVSIYQVWKPLSLRYAANPNDPTLRQVGEWLWQLCGTYGIQSANAINKISGSAPVLSGPSNQSVNVGATATFSVSVTGAIPTFYQWFVNGVLIPGANSASYLVTNAQLTQSGNTYFVTVATSAGLAVSNTATLTVTASITGYLYYTPTNPGPTLLANSDPFSYQINFPITHNQPLSITLTTLAANNQFLVIKVPSTESTKTTWYNTALNNGTIPDLVFEPMVSFGGWDYYYTASLVSLDPTQVLTLT
jgi:hypothetical protein